MLTCKQFLELGVLSGLMHENQVRTTFAPYLRPAKGSTKEAERLSLLIASLVVNGVLTCWQCEQMRVGRQQGVRCRRLQVVGSNTGWGSPLFLSRGEYDYRQPGATHYHW